MDRREFIGGALAALALRSGAETPAAASRLKLGFQVYGVRDLCARDFRGTLRAVRALGYTGVETGRFHGLDGRAFRDMLADCDLACIAFQLYPHMLTEPQLAETIPTNSVGVGKREWRDWRGIKAGNGAASREVLRV